MNAKHYDSGASPVAVSRVAVGQWRVLEDDLVVGRGHSMRRPDGRLFVSIDAWRGIGGRRTGSSVELAR